MTTAEPDDVGRLDDMGCLEDMGHAEDMGRPDELRRPDEAVSRYDAVILAGGGARRLHGADKPGLVVGGRSLVARVGAAVADATRIVLVGPARPELPAAVVVREDPPGGGPVPALRAGLAAVRAPLVAVLAADLPFLTHADVEELRCAARGHSGAILDDEDGRPQWLAGAWRTEELRAAFDGYPGASLRGLMAPLRPVRLRPAARPLPAWYDCDTEDDVVTASRMIEENSAQRVDRGGLRGAEDRSRGRRP